MIAKRMAAAISALVPAMCGLLEICALLTGAGLVAYGAWQVFPPAGPIVAGILLMTGTLLRARGT